MSSNHILSFHATPPPLHTAADLITRVLISTRIRQPSTPHVLVQHWGASSVSSTAHPRVIHSLVNYLSLHAQISRTTSRHRDQFVTHSPGSQSLKQHGKFMALCIVNLTGKLEISRPKYLRWQWRWWKQVNHKFGPIFKHHQKRLHSRRWESTKLITDKQCCTRRNEIQQYINTAHSANAAQEFKNF